jgi:ribosome-associated protein
MLEVNPRLAIPEDEFEFSHARSSGPGGQNVNKTNTKVTLRWPVRTTTSLPEDIKQRFLTRFANRSTLQGALLLTSQRFRDQSRNLADCLAKLKEMLEQVVAPPKPRRPTRTTKGSRERRLQAKRRRSASKQLRQSPSGDR